jgi:hypothetical protein
MTTTDSRPFRSRRGGIIFGLMISALILVCLTIAVGFWVAPNFSVRTSGHDGDNVSIETPVGNLSVHAHQGGVDPESLGLPVYPGARRRDRHEGGGAVIEWTSRDGTSDKALSVAGVEMVTPDPPEKVLEFYKDKLPDGVVRKESGHTLRLELREGGYKRIIAINGNSDGTHIGIARVGDPPAN